MRTINPVQFKKDRDQSKEMSLQINLKETTARPEYPKSLVSTRKSEANPGLHQQRLAFT